MNAMTSQGLALAQRSKSPMGTALVSVSISLCPAANPDVRPLELRLAVVDKALRAVGEEMTARQLAALKLELRREAAIDKELLDGAMVRLKEHASRTSSVGPGVEILARPDAALRPNFPNAFLFLIGTFVAAIAAGLGMAWNPRRSEARGEARGAIAFHEHSSHRPPIRLAN